MAMNRRAVFLDKDGTLIEDVPYNVDPARIELTRGAGKGLRRLHDAGYALLVVSNQSGVARGYFPESALTAVEQRLRDLLAAENVPLAGFYYCPHHPSGTVAPYARGCSCRKPAPGLIERACLDHRLTPHRSWLIGDILDDVQAGRAAGCQTVLLNNGHETEWIVTPRRRPDHLAADLAEAAAIILSFSHPARGAYEPRGRGVAAAP
jgi:D-glycero-D-manno-heptose 1,7-bisphosphate phosphatase